MSVGDGLVLRARWWLRHPRALFRPARTLPRSLRPLVVELGERFQAEGPPTLTPGAGRSRGFRTRSRPSSRASARACSAPSSEPVSAAPISLRGNRLTLDGDDAEGRARRARSSRSLSTSSRAGREDRRRHGRHDPERDRPRPRTCATSSRTSSGRIAASASRRRPSCRSRYVDAIRKGTITFGIGPAGTGKTYLAIALAVAALSERQVGRIILTRPAVEAGERLGFLPGDVLAKVDPYMRPLFDALYDTMDPEKLNAFIERGTIEVAPLAFMRGRAQPLTSPVLTPDGFVPIGGSRVGDLVTRFGRTADARPRRVPTRTQGGLPRRHPGRSVDPVLRGASLACAYAGGQPPREARACARDPRDDGQPAASPPASL